MPSRAGVWRRAMPAGVLLLCMSGLAAGPARAGTNGFQPIRASDNTVAAAVQQFAPPGCSDVPVTALVTAPGLIIGGTGADELLLATIATTTIDGGGGHDCIVGGAMGETIIGGLGTDVCIGGPGTDVFDPSCDTQVQ